MFRECNPVGLKTKEVTTTDLTIASIRGNTNIIMVCSQCQTRCVISTVDSWEMGNKLARGKESGTMMEYGNTSYGIPIEHSSIFIWHTFNIMRFPSPLHCVDSNRTRTLLELTFEVVGPGPGLGAGSTVSQVPQPTRSCRPVIQAHKGCKPSP